MRFKRLLSTALAAALTLGLLTAAPVSAVQGSSFSDLTDPQQAEYVEFLHVMGVVHGDPGGTYRPTGTLTRAEFCKMAVAVLGRSDEEPAHRGRTIYPDVGSGHWARGYINLASAISLGGGEEGKRGIALVGGMGDGTFQPNRPITYAEAVAILCRILGYDGADVATGGAWYSGYLAAGTSSGLTEGIGLAGSDVITRGQAANLFYNLYFAKPKGSNQSYMVSIGGREVDNSVIIDVDAKADDGSSAVETTQSTYRADRIFDPSVEGKLGKAILDADGRLVAFVPRSGTSQKVINVTSTEATYLIASGGDKITVEPDTTVYQNGKTTTWREAYLNVTPGSAAVFHYGANGKLSHVFFGSAAVDSITAMVARTAPTGGTNPFAAMASGGNYTMFKNGIAAAAGDIRQYDVATYDPGTRVIRICDMKLTGIYENASPSVAAPTSITLMGHAFPVLSSARNDLAAFKVGDRITLLLTADNQVAGVVSANVVQGDAVGVATVSDNGYATVKLLQNGLEVQGQGPNEAKERFDNQLVTVTSAGINKLSLSLVAGSTVKGSLNVAARTLGGRQVAENVVVYDRVKNSTMVQVPYGELTVAAIPQSKISFVAYDYAGRVKYIVLNDATGDAYTYGLFSYTPGVDYGSSADPARLCVKLAGEDGRETTSDEGSFIGSVRNGEPGGVAFAPSTVAKSPVPLKVAASVTLQSLTGVRRSAFDPEEMTVTVAGVSYPVASNVQCYNKTTKTWFVPGKAGMEAARAYSDSLTLYYDRAPDEGGKIRIIVVS